MFVLIHKDADSDYGVSFPDLPGCVTAGRTVAEALSMAKEALTLHIDNMLEHGEEIPIATPADKIDRDDALLVVPIDVTDALTAGGVSVTVPAEAHRRTESA